MTIAAQRNLKKAWREGATKLDLGYLGLMEVPEQIAHLTNLQQLYLYDNHAVH